jgi:hypothetical protein
VDVALRDEPDGIQYLDNASAYRQGNFRNALNLQWSPLYPWLVAGAEAIVRPSHEQEFGLTHAVNFTLFAATIACFSLFLKSMTISHSFATSRPICW